MSFDFEPRVNIVKDITKRFGFNSLNHQISSIENLLEQEKVIDIAVLGQFKAGKSSFLNSFIGKALLPVGVLPVTSVITRLQYSKVPKAVVTKYNGESFEITLGEISDFVTESKNPLNKKNVLSLDVYHPLLRNYANLRFVDTPGLDSIFKHNTETTKNWLVAAGIAIMVISAERPLSESDVLLIKEIQNYSPEVVILMTKVDLFSRKELDEITFFISDSINKEINKNLKICHYSTIENTVKFKEKIKNELLNPLINSFDEEYSIILEHKIVSVVKSCKGYLELAYQASLREEEERNKLRNLIIDEKLSIDFVRRELSLIAASYTGLTRDKLTQNLLGYFESVKNNIVDKFREEFDGWKGNLYKISNKYNALIKENLINELSFILSKEEEIFKSIINIPVKHFSNYARSFRERLNENLSKVFNIQIPVESWKIEEEYNIKPDISVSKVFDMQIDLIWFLFPMFIFKNTFRKHLINQIPLDVERNLYRFISDLTEKVNKNIEEKKKHTLQYILSEIDTIVSILKNNHSNSEEISELINTLNGMINIQSSVKL